MEGLFVSVHDPGGDPPSVVLVHGTLDRSAAFIRVQRLLTDLRVVRYDRRGYGHSLAAGVATGFDVHVDDLRSVVDGRPSVLVGHSMGGAIALALAERHPELVQAVVAYEAPMPWVPWWPRTSIGSRALAEARDPFDAAERFMRRMIGDERWEALPERTREQRRAEGPALVADITAMRDRERPPYDPTRVTVPVVVAYGSETLDYHRRAALELAEQAPDTELVVVDGASHGVHLSHPAALADLARRAVGRAAGDATAGGSAEAHG